MEYIYIGAAALGGGWTGYLIGQFSSVKEMNRRLNALVAESKIRQEQLETFAHEANFQIELNGRLQSEVDRQADIIAKYQRNQPEREANGKFASKKKRVTAELAAYVASQRPL
jgi:hypothetical protein